MIRLGLDDITESGVGDREFVAILIMSEMSQSSLGLCQSSPRAPPDPPKAPPDFTQTLPKLSSAFQSSSIGAQCLQSSLEVSLL